METRLIEILAKHYTGEVNRDNTTKALEALRAEAGADSALDELMSNWNPPASRTDIMADWTYSKERPYHKNRHCLRVPLQRTIITKR